MEFVFKILAWALPTKNVETVVASLGKFIDKLLEAEAEQNRIRYEAQARIRELTEVSNAAKADAERAARVAEKLRDLLA